MKNIFKKLINTKKNRGFTVLETLVAIFILVLAITGPMVFAQTGLRSAFLARDQITAFFLAQDAIETIKNVRDNNALKNRDWLYGLYENCRINPGTNCLISVETDLGNGNVKIESCPDTGCRNLKNDSTGRFGYTLSEGVESRFTRNIYLTEVSTNRELRIVAEVKWTSNVRINESRIIVQENIFNWIPKAQQPPL